MVTLQGKSSEGINHLEADVDMVFTLTENSLPSV